jgi:lipopolysaccharide cholinephosphotransferase
MYKYMRDDLKDEYGLLKLQDKILEIAVYIDKFCQENDIDYCLMGGSALGAKRHGGFIPWDDDLDIFMTVEAYEKFREKFKKEGNKKQFYLQEFGSIDGMITLAKIRDNKTTYIESLYKEWNMHQGIFVDIFILHNCPDNFFKQCWQFFWAKYLITKGMSLKKYNRAYGIKKIILKIADLLPENFLISYALKQVYRFKNIKSNHYCNFLGKAMFKNAIYEKEIFKKIEYCKFEKVQLKIPTKIEIFLRKRFGDYMKVPSPEKIKWEQHAEFWDVDNSFKKYIKTTSIFKDEVKLL